MFDKQQWMMTFAQLNIKKGMLVVLDGDLFEPERTINQANTFLDALLSVLTSEGTVVCFSHNESQIEPSQWDVDVDVSAYQTIRENLTLSTNLLARSDVLRSTMLLRDDVLIKRHPLYNVMAIGKYARFVTRKIPLNFPNGPHSPMQSSADLKGHVLILNEVGQNSYPLRYGLVDDLSPVYVSGGVSIEHGVAYWQKFLDHKVSHQQLHDVFDEMQVQTDYVELGENKLWLLPIEKLSVSQA